MYYSQIRVDPGDNNHLYVLGTSLYRSKDGGAEFTGDGAGREVHVDHHALWVDPKDGRHMILGNDGGLYVTYDRMKTWDHHNHIAICQFYHVGISSDDDYHVYGGLQDNGSWGGPTRVADASGPMNSDWFRVGGGDGFVCLVDPTDENQIYFESQNGAMGRIHLKTGERGFIRPRPPRGTRYRFNWKTPFLLSPHNPAIHYSAGNHVFKSVSKGDRVAAISPEITNTDKGAGSAITESPRKPGVIYAGTTDGALWMTLDDGKSWIDLFDEESLKQFDDNSEATATTQRLGPSARGPGGAGQGRGPGGPGGRGGRGGRGRMDPERLMQFVLSQDQNGDGVVDKSEVPERMQGLFERFDRNGDDQITKAELAPAAAPSESAADPEESQDAERVSGESAVDADSNDADESVGEPAKSNQKEGEAGDKEAAEGAIKAEEAIKPKGKGESVTAATDDKAGEAKAEELTEEEDPLSGTYEGKFVSENMPAGEGFTLVLRLQAENKVKGSFESSRSNGDITEGKYNPASGAITLAATTDQAELEFTCKLSGTTMTGTIDINGGSFSIDFEAKRIGDATGEMDAEEESDGNVPLYELVPEPRWVSSLHASSFADGRCYLTLDGHRSNDDEPYLFVTENFGKTWRSIRANLPTEAGSTRVLREDIENENVLYLGCEFSIWGSIDRGESWTRLNSNLPTVAVHEIAQHPTRGEIVAGTHGRAVWIMDATALRQLSSETLQAKATLYDPNTAIRWRSGVERGSAGTRDFVGENPPAGAKIYYSLGSSARSAQLTISTLLGETLYDEEVETSAGLHAVDWNLRRASTGSRRSSSVPTGEYLVQLRVDGQDYKTTLRVVSDPSRPEPVTSEEEVEFWEAMLGLNDEEGSGEASDFDL